MVGERVRLRLVDEIEECALAWYQDEEMLKLVDGKNAKAYDKEQLERMYQYLRNAGELYWIEVMENDQYKPIGDVTLCKDDLPIVIGEGRYSGKGIGSCVLDLIKERARELGYRELYVREIYDYNRGSQRLFEKAGFKKVEKTEEGWGYRYDF